MNGWVGFKKDVCMRSDSRPPPSGFRLTQDSLDEPYHGLSLVREKNAPLHMLHKHAPLHMLHKHAPLHMLHKHAPLHMLHKHACGTNDLIIFKREVACNDIYLA